MTEEQAHTSSHVISPDVAVWHCLIARECSACRENIADRKDRWFASEGEDPPSHGINFGFNFCDLIKTGNFESCTNANITGCVKAAPHWWEQWGKRFTDTEVLSALLSTAWGLSSLLHSPFNLYSLFYCFYRHSLFSNSVKRFCLMFALFFIVSDTFRFLRVGSAVSRAVSLNRHQKRPSWILQDKRFRQRLLLPTCGLSFVEKKFTLFPMSDFAWGAFLSGSILLYTPETRQSITIFTVSNELRDFFFFFQARS